jgi:hypothetical protein
VANFVELLYFDGILLLRCACTNLQPEVGERFRQDLRPEQAEIVG